MQVADFIPESANFFIYTPNPSVFDAGRLFAEVMRGPHPFDGPPQVVPFPENLQHPDVPRVTLHSRDKTWQLNASPTSVTVARQFSLDQNASEDEIVAVAETCRRLVSALDLQVGRVGLNVQRVVREPDANLVSLFLKDEFTNQGEVDAPFRNSKRLELNNYKQYSVAGFRDNQAATTVVNSWVRCSGFEEGGIYVVRVLQDINTLNENINEDRYSADDLKRFAATSWLEMSSILGKYFRG